jgi:rubrerythrin
LLKNQKALEETTVERLTSFYNTVQNSLVKAFIQHIILDTTKHAEMYQTLIDLNTRALVGPIDRKTMIKELTTHIQEETQMLNKAIVIMNEITDDKFKRLVERIIDEERRHHYILEELYEILEKEGEDWNHYFYELMKDYP